jgi:IS5 family transposase
VWNNRGRKIKYRIDRRPSQIRKLSGSGQYTAKKAEHRKFSVRAKAEHVFAWSRAFSDTEKHGTGG